MPSGPDNHFCRDMSNLVGVWDAQLRLIYYTG